MALIECKKCGKNVSDKALKCPHCGTSTEPNDSRMSRYLLAAIFALLIFWGPISKRLYIDDWYFIIDFIVGILFGVIAIKQTLTNNALGRIGAGISSIIFILYSIDYLSPFCSYSLRICLDSASILFIGLLLFNTKINKITAILGVISFIYPLYYDIFSFYIDQDLYWFINILNVVLKVTTCILILLSYKIRTNPLN